MQDYTAHVLPKAQIFKWHQVFWDELKVREGKPHFNYFTNWIKCDITEDLSCLANDINDWWWINIDQMIFQDCQPEKWKFSVITF